MIFFKYQALSEVCGCPGEENKIPADFQKNWTLMQREVQRGDPSDVQQGEDLQCLAYPRGILETSSFFIWRYLLDFFCCFAAQVLSLRAQSLIHEQ